MRGPPSLVVHHSGFSLPSPVVSRGPSRSNIASASGVSVQACIQESIAEFMLSNPDCLKKLDVTMGQSRALRFRMYWYPLRCSEVPRATRASPWQAAAQRRDLRPMQRGEAFPRVGPAANTDLGIRIYAQHPSVASRSSSVPACSRFPGPSPAASAHAHTPRGLARKQGHRQVLPLPSPQVSNAREMHYCCC